VLTPHGLSLALLNTVWAFMKCTCFMLWFHSEDILSNAALIAVGNISCDVNVNVDDWFFRRGNDPLWTCFAVSVNAGYGHTVGTLQGLSLIPVAIGGCTFVPRTVHAVPRTVHAVPKTVHAVPKTVHDVPETVHAVLKTVHAVPGLIKLSKIMSLAHKYATSAAAIATAEEL